MSLHEFPGFPLRQAIRGAFAAVQELPVPDENAIKHSQRLIEHIRQRIEQQGGQITFSEFMSLALMAPGLGYYSAGSQKFGAAGDFVTAPEISSLFSYCLARQCEQVLAALSGSESKVILEIGAGSGRMAVDLLTALDLTKALPDKYFILEPSADLQQRQRDYIVDKLPQCLDSVEWLEQLPEEGINGVIIANEILDVLPVHRFLATGNAYQEYYVGWDNDCFQWQLGKVSDGALEKSLDNLNLAALDGYSSEFCLATHGWVASVAKSLNRGLILLIDYGYPRREYYHPQRVTGTLLCHYRHRAHADPFVYPGLQDITAHVDFTAVAEAALDAKLRVAGYNTQGQFLVSCGIDKVVDVAELGDERQVLAYSQQIKQLTLPSEMGEIFKVMALTRDFDHPLLGFSMFDLRNKL